jgi:superfamily I DNA/RNA helicase
MAFIETPQHRAIFDAVARGRSVVVEAVAGGGKSTALRAAIEHVTPGRSILVLAFNRSIAEEMAAKLGRGVECRTVNSLGHRAWAGHCRRNRVSVRVDADKLWSMLDRLVDDGEVGAGDAKVYGVAAVQLARFAKASGVLIESAGLVPDDLSTWDWLLRHFDVDVPETKAGAAADETAVRELCRTILRRSVSVWDVVDFDDQVYMPFAHDVATTRYDTIFADEAQDLSPLQLDLIRRSLRKGGQLVAVGDRNQSLYGFRGADVRSLDRIAETFSAACLPLSVTYRCPKLVVKLAQTIAPQIQARDDAPDGVLERAPVRATDVLDRLQGGDLVVSRTNAPIVRLAYALLRARRPATIIGRDLGAGIASLIKQLKATDPADLGGRVQRWRTKEIDRLTRQKASEAKLGMVDDKADTVLALTEGADSITEILSTVDQLFRDRGDGTRILLSSIHRAKGLEADRVWILNPQLMPHPMAKQAWEKEQEQCAIYVAVTRAKAELRYIDDGTVFQKRNSKAA